ncbi:MAG: hypothetical protein AAFR39_08210, partial [Pseudomonadota bacterium]
PTNPYTLSLHDAPIFVTERLPRKHVGDPAQRQKDELVQLRENQCISCTLLVPDAAAPIIVTADLARRTVDVGMTLKAPEDKKSIKARVNWLLRQVKEDDVEGIFIRLLWPGTSEPTQYPAADLRIDPDLAAAGKEHLTPHGFHIFLSERLGGKFAQQTNFVAELERIVPKFYGETGARLVAWVKKAPQVKSDRTSDKDVSPMALSEDAEDFGRIN